MYLRDCRSCISVSTADFATCGSFHELHSRWFQDVESSRRARHSAAAATPAFEKGEEAGQLEGKVHGVEHTHV
jgi:hypothetical protein